MNQELGIRNQHVVNQESGIRNYGLSWFKQHIKPLIPYSLFIIPAIATFVAIAQPASAHQHMDQSCFTKAECEDQGGVYKGIADQAADCQGQAKEWVDAGLTYYCYPQQKEYKLQVPFLSPIFRSTTKSLEDYISILYQLLISIAGIIAGIMIVWAGVKWLTSGGNPERISDARHKIGNALIGIILTLSSYVLLQTINPDLVRLRVPPIKMFRAHVLEPWCPNDGPFQGKYACGRDDYAVPGIGKCAGAHCDQGGCYRWKDLNQESRTQCLEKDKCPSKCTDITPETLGVNWSAYCNTDICKDKIQQLCRINRPLGETKEKCVDRIEEGGNFCEKNSDCVPSLICNTATVPNTCQKPGRFPKGASCDKDSQCQTGLVCNNAYFKDQCQSPFPGGTACADDNECLHGNCDINNITVFSPLTGGDISGCCRCTEAGAGLQDCNILWPCTDQ